MALVGEAHIIVRAITDRVNSDIRRGFNGASGEGRRAGTDLGNGFAKGFASKANANMFSRISDGLNSMVPGADRARDAYRSLSAAGFALGPAISSGIGGISAIIGSLGALIGTAGSAAGALASIGNAAVAIKGGLGVAKLALGGIGRAVSLATAPARGGGGGGAAASTAAKAAAARTKKLVADSRAERSAREAVQEAEKSLARTIQSNRETMSDANDRVKKSQIELNKAIEDGRKALRDLAFQAEGAALDEQGAALALKKARTDLAAVQDLPPNNSARQAAELAYKQADLSYREAKSSAQQFASDQAKATATGIAGTKEYKSAAEDLADAQKDQGRSARDNAQSQADAEDAVAKARRNAKEAKEKTGQDAAEPIASPAGGGGGGGGADPFAGLNKAQKEFAQFLISLKPKLDQLRETAANAFLPPLQNAITTLVNRAFPTVNKGVGEIAKSMGVAANTIADTITSSKDLENLGSLFTSSAKLIETFGSIIGKAFGIILSILTKSAPTAQNLANSLDRVLGKFDAFLKAPENQKGIEDFFIDAEKSLRLFGDLFGNVFKGFGAIIKANMGDGSAGKELLKFFIQGTKGFADLNNAAGQKKLKGYFSDVVANAKPVLSLIGDIVKVLVKMGRKKEIGETFNILRDAIPYIQSLADKTAEAGPSLAKAVVQLVKLFDALQDSGALKIFLDTLTDIIGTTDDFASSPTGQNILTLLGRFFAFSLAFTTAGKAASFFSKVIVGDVAHGFALLGKAGTGVAGIAKVGTTLGSVTRNGAGLRQGLAELTYSSNGFARKFGEVGGKVVEGFGKMKEGALKFADKAYFAGRAAGNKIKDAFSTASTSIGRGFNTVRGKAAQGMTAIGSAAGRAASRVRGVASAAVDLAKRAALTTASVVKGFAQQAASAVAAKARLIAVKAAQLAISAATKIAAAAQVVFNAILSANPLGLIITAIGLVIGALVLFFTKTKLGKEIWANFTKFLTEAFNNVVSFFQDAIGNVVGFFKQFGPGILLVIAPFLGIPLLIASHWGDIVKFFTDLWTNVSNAVKAGIDFVAGIINDVLSFIVEVIKGYLNFVIGFWTGVFNTLVSVVRTIFDFVSGIINTVLSFIVDVIKGYLNFVIGFWTGVFNTISGIVKTAFDAVVNFIRVGLQVGKGIIDTVVGVIVGIFTTQWGKISSFVDDVFKNVVNFVRTGLNNTKTIIDTITGAIGKIWNTFWGGVYNFAKGIIDKVIEAIKGIRKGFEDVFDGLKGIAEGAFKGVIGVVRTPMNGLISLVNGVIRTINGISFDLPKALGGAHVGFNLPTLPQLAKGGIVSPSPGGSIVNVAEAGRPERITPLDSDGLSAGDKAVLDAVKNSSGAPVTINVYPSAGASNSEIAAMVNQEISFRMRKGAVA